MPFKVTSPDAIQNQGIPITEDAYKATSEAYGRLTVLRSIEEKLDQLLENFIEYEECLLSIALRKSVRPFLDESVLMAARRTVARRLANLLTAGSLYVDQVTQDVNSIYGNDSDVSKALDVAVKTEYDACLGYRVMAALRNHVQHRNSFVGTISYPFEWKDAEAPDGMGRWRFRVVPHLDVARLEADGGFKPKVLAELKGITVEQGPGAAIPLTPFARQYVQSLGKVHEVLRILMADDVKQWEDRVEVILGMGEVASAFTTSGAAVVGHGEPLAGVLFLSPELLSYRRDLAKRNRTFANLSARFVSSEQD